MREDKFIGLVTSKAWRGQLATILLQHISPGEVEQSDLHQMLVHYGFGGDWKAAARQYLGQNKPVPAAIVRGILDDLERPKKRGRNARKEQRAEQLADDIACFLATEHLMKKKGKRLRVSPACEQVGALMAGKRMSRQAVSDARERGLAAIQALETQSLKLQENL